MQDKWQINREYLKNSIDKGIRLLTEEKLSNYKRRIIREEIKTYRNILNNKFENDDSQNISESFKSMETIKKYVLNNMKKQYQSLGKNIINYIIKLNEERIFEVDFPWNATTLSIEEQEKLTLENYENHSKYYLSYAKKFLSDPISKIQIIENEEIGSRCYCSQINKEPLIIVDPEDMAAILNHEIQHAIEYMLKCYSYIYYDELGPIYFELLFFDLLKEKQGYLLPGDYALRLEETEMYLYDLSSYFKIIKTFAKDNFEVSLEKFNNVFMEYYGLSQELIEPYLLNYIDTYGKDIDINYLLSYLKALELRDSLKDNKEDKDKYIRQYIKSKKLIYNPSSKNFKIYEKYIEEMKSITKNSI